MKEDEEEILVHGFNALHDEGILFNTNIIF